MSDKITLDRETFKALAADTRVEILKRIAKHKLTLTDLAEEMNMSPSTIKEHLDRLIEAGLIEADDRGMKWKYYRLTDKGRNIVSPYETKVWILLSISVLVLAGSVLSLAWKTTDFYAYSPLKASGEGMSAPVALAAHNETAGVAVEDAPRLLADEATAKVTSAGGGGGRESAVYSSGVVDEKSSNAEAQGDVGGNSSAVGEPGVTWQPPYVELTLVFASLAVSAACITYLAGGRLRPR